MLNLFNGQQISPPTIKVSLQNMPFRFFFLGGLLDFRDMQTATTTMTSGDLYLLSDNEKGLFRLTVSNEAIGRSTRSFWSSAKNCVRLQSRCDSAVRELTKTYRRSNIAH